MSELSTLHSKMLIVDALLKGNGLQHIVNVASEVLGFPMLISDASHKILAITNMEIDDPFWKEMQALRYGPYAEMVKTVNAGTEYQLMRSSRPVRFQYQFFKHNWVLTRILIDGKTCGHVCVMEYRHPMNDENMDMLVMLTDVVKCELQKSISRTRSSTAMVQHFLQDLLDSESADKELIQKRADYFFKIIKSNLFVLSFKYLHTFGDSNALSYLVERINDLLPGSRGLVYSNMVVILLMTNEVDAMHGKDLCEKLERFLDDNNMVCGISREFHDMADFRRHYTQSVNAIKCGTRLFPKARFYYYDDLAIFSMLDVIASHTDILDFCLPSLINLLEYDEQNRTEFVKSLYFYLKADKNAAVAAKQLQIHRNTMDYRLRKSSEIMRLNLSNSDISKQIMYSFDVLFYTRGPEFIEMMISEN